MLGLLSSAGLLAGLEAEAAAKPVQAEIGPRLIVGSDNPDCLHALAVAKAAFLSTAGRVSAAPSDIQKNVRAGLLLAPTGSDEFLIDSNFIETREVNESGIRTMYVQRNPVAGFRFVVTRRPFNWQGDWYGLYRVSGSVAIDDLGKVLTQEQEDTGKAKTILKDEWQRPWLVLDPATQHIVAIDTQHPANFLADWQIYTPVPAGPPHAVCRIGFRPKVEHARDLLPAGALRELARLLDAMVGVPSAPEGTLNPIARIRVDVETMWANLALRPWALQEPYNTPAEVDQGLKRWARTRSAYRAQYRRLHELHRRALKSLSRYYRTTLHKPPQEAASLARQSLARAIGAHFVFAKGE